MGSAARAACGLMGSAARAACGLNPQIRGALWSRLWRGKLAKQLLQLGAFPVRQLGLVVCRRRRRLRGAARGCAAVHVPSCSAGGHVSRASERGGGTMTPRRRRRCSRRRQARHAECRCGDESSSPFGLGLKVMPHWRVSCVVELIRGTIRLCPAVPVGHLHMLIEILAAERRRSRVLDGCQRRRE